jgi:hypothetical protein
MLQKGHFLVDGTRWSVESAEAPETETDGRDLGAISAQGSQGKRHFEVREALKEDKGREESLCWSEQYPALS